MDFMRLRERVARMSHLSEFASEGKRMFDNAQLFNAVGSQVYVDAAMLRLLFLRFTAVIATGAPLRALGLAAADAAAAAATTTTAVTPSSRPAPRSIRVRVRAAGGGGGGGSDAVRHEATEEEAAVAAAGTPGSSAMSSGGAFKFKIKLGSRSCNAAPDTPPGADRAVEAAEAVEAEMAEVAGLGAAAVGASPEGGFKRSSRGRSSQQYSS
jgi:hypothetical protein